MPLSLDEIDRYQRQALLPEWGGAGQEALKAACVIVQGKGPAARAASLYLAGAGVGELRVDSAEMIDEARALNPLVKLVQEYRAGLIPHALVILVPGIVWNGRAAEIVGNQDREAIGAACALEAIKALLGLRCSQSVELPS